MQLLEGVHHLTFVTSDMDRLVAFWELRRRVVEEGAGDGSVTDMGSLLNLGFTDPDGGEHEVVWVKPGVPVEEGLRRAEWSPARLP